MFTHRISLLVLRKVLQMLSDKQVRALKSVGKDVLKSDSCGLYIRVSIHGTKTFVYRKKQNGTTRYATPREFLHTCGGQL